jgi:putative ABC transport system permease protein
MKKEYWVMSLKNLKHRGIRTWLTLLGIFIGVMAVVALIGLGNALQAAISAQFGISSTEVVTIQAGGVTYGPPGTGVATPLTVKDVEVVSDVRNVELAIRRNLPLGKLEYNKRAIFGTATNIPSDSEARKFVYELLNVKALKGSLIEPSDNNEIVVGYNFYANKVGLQREITIGDKVLIQGKGFKVTGILEKTGSMIFDNIVLMNEEDLKDTMGYGDKVDLIGVKLKDKTKIEQTKLDLEKALRKSRGVKEGEEDFQVSTPEAMMSTVNDIIMGVQIFVLLIALISVFVGAIGIVNTMTTSVVERRKEIGIMKAIGAKNSQVFYQFFIEAGLLGLIGGIVGAIFGTLISMGGIVGLNSFLGSELTLEIDYLLVSLTLLGSFSIGAISGIIPAMSAAKQNPVEALRG